jgi:hypothetical protein
MQHPHEGLAIVTCFAVRFIAIVRIFRPHVRDCRGCVDPQRQHPRSEGQDFLQVNDCGLDIKFNMNLTFDGFQMFVFAVNDDEQVVFAIA